MHLGTIVLCEITGLSRGIGECHELVDVHGRSRYHRKIVVTGLAAALVIAVIGIAVQHLNLASIL